MKSKLRICVAIEYLIKLCTFLSIKGNSLWIYLGFMAISIHLPFMLCLSFFTVMSVSLTCLINNTCAGCLKARICGLKKFVQKIISADYITISLHRNNRYKSEIHPLRIL